MKLQEAAQQALEYLEQHAIISGAQIQDALRAALSDATCQESRQVEPVAYMMVNKTHKHAPCLHFTPPEDWHATWEAVPLYLAPPQRKPLTEESLLYIYNQLPNWGMDMDSLPQGLEKFARAVERAHGIKE